jgi:hypothetical protein
MLRPLPVRRPRVRHGDIGSGAGSTTMKALVRFLAGFLLLIAVVFAVYDGTVSHASGRVSFATIQDTWSAVAPASLKAAQASVQRSSHPLVWTWGVANVLQLPAWAVFGVLGLLLAYFGRERRRINIYAN